MRRIHHLCHKRSDQVAKGVCLLVLCAVLFIASPAYAKTLVHSETLHPTNAQEIPRIWVDPVTGLRCKLISVRSLKDREAKAQSFETRSTRIKVPSAEVTSTSTAALRRRFPKHADVDSDGFIGQIPLLNFETFPVVETVSRRVERTVDLVASDNDIEDLPTQMLFDTTSGEQVLERESVSFDVLERDDTQTQRGEDGKPTAYKVAMVFRGVEEYSDVTHYEAIAHYKGKVPYAAANGEAVKAVYRYEEESTVAIPAATATPANEGPSRSSSSGTPRRFSVPAVPLVFGMCALLMPAVGFVLTREMKQKTKEKVLAAVVGGGALVIVVVVLLLNASQALAAENAILITKTAEDRQIGGHRFRIMELGGHEGAYDQTFTTDATGTITAPLLEPGTYRVAEVDVAQRYRAPLTQVVSFESSSTATATLTFENLLVRGGFKVAAHDLDDPETPLPNTHFEIYQRTGSIFSPAWRLYAACSTDLKGDASIKDIPYGDYYVAESRPAHQYLNEAESCEPRYWSIRSDGQEVCEAYYNEHEKLSCFVGLSTIRRTQERDVYRYDVTGLANTSNTVGDDFTVSSEIDTSAVRLRDIYTGTYSKDSDEKLRVLYRTNMEDWRSWEESVSTTSQMHLFADDLDLQQGEYVQAFKYDFGGVQKGFADISPPSYFVTVLPGVTPTSPGQGIVGSVEARIERSDMTAHSSNDANTQLMDTLGFTVASTPLPEFGTATVKNLVKEKGPHMADLDLIPYILIIVCSMILGAICAAKTLQEQREGCASGTSILLRMRLRIQKAFTGESGQGTTEYAIIVGVLVVIAILAVTAFKGKIQELWDQISSGIMGL